METNDLKLAITKAYNDFASKNGVEPNVAYIKGQWSDETDSDGALRTIVIDDSFLENPMGFVPYISDDMVFYYCTDLANFLELADPYSDFVITEFLGFEHLY